MSVPYTFATQSGNIPLSELDANFSNVSAYTDTAGTVTQATQANITSVGTLSSLTVAGNVSGSYFLGNGSQLTGIVATSTYGNANVAEFLPTYSGNLTSVSAVPGSAITGTVANATYALTANAATYSVQSTYAGTANAVAGANVSGTVANATYALTANAATYSTQSTYAGTANSISGANISGTVANATYALTANAATYASVATYAGTANAVAGANVSGTVANATYATSAGSATTATTSTYAGTANAVAGANVSGTVANATYALTANVATSATTAGTVTTAAQGNITSVGTLTSLSVSGNITAGNLDAVNLVINSISSDDSTVVSVQDGLQVYGDIIADNIGNIASIDLDGNVSNVLSGSGTWITAGGGAANTGNVTFDDVNIIGTGNLNLQPNGASSEYLNIYLTGSTDIHVAAGNGSGNVILGTDEEANVAVLQGGNVAIQAGNVAGKQTWAFDTAGNLTLPGNAFAVNYANGTAVSLGGSYGNADVATFLAAYGSNTISTTGNVTAGYFIGNGSALSSLTAANVSGTVANATYALTANAATYSTQATIADTANAVTGANVSGTVANATYALTANVATYSTQATYADTANAVAGANVSGTVANATYATSAGSATTATSATTAATVTTAAQPNITSVGTLTSVNSTGNVTAGGLTINGTGVVTGNLQVQGNLIYNNLTNITTPNLVFGLANTSIGISANGAGFVVGNTAEASFLYNYTAQTWDSNIGISVVGNITGSNLVTAGQVSAAGNVTGNYILGNGALLTGVITSVANINLGTSNVTVVSSGGNVSVGVGGTPNVAVFASTGEYITGVLSVSGNANVGNIGATNVVATNIAGTLTTAAQTNITSVGTLGTLSVTGNASTGNVSGTTGTFTNIAGTLTTAAQPNITSTGTLTSLTVTGNVTGGNLITGGLATVTGNITAGNLVTAGMLSATGNANVGNLGATSVVATNLTGTLTTNAQPNITSTGTLTSLTVTGNVAGGNITTAGQVSAIGNITTANSFVGNLVGTTASVTGNVTAGNISAGNVIINGQSTTYGVVTPAYMVVGLVNSIAGFGVGNTVIFDTVVGNINSQTSYNASTGVFTLTAGVTYDMSFTPSLISFTNLTGGFLCYDWVDATSNALLDTTGIGTGTSIPVTETSGQIDNTTARVIYTPSTNQTVKLRVNTANGTATLRGAIGTQAIIKPLNPTIAVQATATGTVSATVVANTSPNTTTTTGGSSTSPALTVLTVAIPSAGTWRLDAELRAYIPGAGYMAAAFYDNGTVISGSEYFVAAGGVTQTGAATGQYGGFMSYNLTTTSARTVTLGFWSTTSSQFISSDDGRTWLRATQIDSIFALNTLATMSTTGNVSVGGNLSVTGNITSTPVGFRATTPVTNVSVNNGSSVTMLFGTEEVDTKNLYDPATGRFTPNVAGYYSVSWFIVTSANGAGELLVTLAKNGTDIAWGTNVVNATGHWNGVGGSTGMVYLNGTTDYINVKLTNNSGSTATVYSGSLSYFSAYLIR